MKIKFLIIVFFSTILSFSQNTAPSFKEVVTEFYNQYDVRSTVESNYVQFEKRDSGWNVVTISPTLKDTLNEVFWDNSKESYKTINFPPKLKQKDEEVAIASFINNASFKRFDSLLYYGYVGWEKDLIAFYESKNGLNEIEIYQLGYAYSNYANGLLNDNFGFSDKKVKFNLPIFSNSMTNEQLQTYLFWENKSIEAYLKLFKINPNFETIPGQIGIKYYNEIASNFLNLRIYQNEEIALAQLKDKDLYSNNYREYAKNILDSCEKDGILFTMGDNDTFPLLVYQAQNNYRTDVLIVNTTLLQVPHYINAMMNKVLDSDGIKLSVNSDFIKDNLNEAFVFTKRNKDFISIDNLSLIVLDPSNLYKTHTNSYRSIPSNNFKFNKNKSILNWSIDGHVMYRKTLMALDVIGKNNWKRPIYFAINGSIDSYLGLSKYLQLEGLVYKLVSTEGKITDDEIGFVNPSKLEHNMKTMYQFKDKFNLSIEERQLGMDYRLIYNRLANYYIEQNDYKKAQFILDDCIKLYPNDLASYSFDLISILESYYKLKSFKKAKVLENQLLQNLNNGFDNYIFLTSDEKEARHGRTKNTLQRLKEIYGVK
ncbi:hypothetical protein ACFSX9_11970 [Flavobacterium ardleyense]|uniref:Uncharacterized protein n=1 Tax=Flavobacterium ardleyense TaxID=2038737 RepID=A0ABW5ZAD2_9FLAO